MQFFDSFFSLGYSAINITLVFVVAAVVLYRYTRRWLQHPIAKAAFVAVCVAGFVASVNFLASENRKLNEAIRAEGGLKRTLPEGQ